MESFCRLEHFGPLLGYCDHQVQKVLDRELKNSGYDVSPMQCRTLMYLHSQNGPVTQKQLEQYLRVKPSTVNGIVSRLEEKRLLTRCPSTEDARCRVLQLTALGQGFHHDMRQIVERVSRRMETGFTSEEIAVLTGYLQRIACNLTTPGEDSV